METSGFWRRFDLVLLVAITVLVIFGIMMIASATQDAIDDDLIRRVRDQINFAIVGFIAVLVLAALDYRLLGGLSPWLYVVMLALLLMVHIFGVEGAGGAQRWLNVGIRIQPSEIGKIILIITLSQHLADRYLNLDQLSAVLRSLLHVAIPAVLIFLQPDLGTTIVFIFIWAVIIWSAGFRLRHIALFFAAGLVLLPLAFTQLAPYQILRISTFLNPESDPDAAYNIDQALISIGSGGVLGKGYAVGPQNTGRFLRVRHTDFIFSVIAHEFGIVGGVGRHSSTGLGFDAYLERRARSERSARQYDLLWCRSHDLLSNRGIHRNESRLATGDGPYPAFCKLGRHIAAVYHGWRGSGAKRHRPPQADQCLIVHLHNRFDQLNRDKQES